METEDGTFCYDKTGRAGTAAGGKVDANGRFFPVGKQTFQFLLGGIGQRKHGTTSSVARNM